MGKQSSSSVEAEAVGTSGVFICFEGGEGAGKTTQAKRLYQRLLEKQLPAILAREPGGTILGEAIRKILLENVPGSLPLGEQALAQSVLSPMEEFMLFSAARHRLVDEVIIPGLTAGKILVLDRYFYSSYAYQGAEGLDLDFMKIVTERVVKGFLPDLVILLDILPKVGLKRKLASPTAESIDRFLMKDNAFHERVRQMFVHLASEEPERFAVVDASEEAETVEKKVWEAVSLLLAKKKFLRDG